MTSPTPALDAMAADATREIHRVADDVCGDVCGDVWADWQERFSQAVKPFLQRAFDLGSRVASSVSGDAPTQRALIEAKREGYAMGARDWVREEFAFASNVAAKAAERFPFPKISRPRVVEDLESEHGTDWRCVKGELEFQRAHGDWHPMLGRINDGPAFYGTIFKPTPKRVALWADLLANPTEEVEDVVSSSSLPVEKQVDR